MFGSGGLIGGAVLIVWFLDRPYKAAEELRKQCEADCARLHKELELEEKDGRGKAAAEVRDQLQARYRYCREQSPLAKAAASYLPKPGGAVTQTIDPTTKQEATPSKPVDLERGTPEDLLSAGNRELQEGKFPEAMKALDSALAKRARFPEALVARGRALIYLRRPEDAVKDLDLAIQLKPDFASAHVARGVAMFGLGRYHECLRSADVAAHIDPKDARAHFYQGLCWSSLDALDEAQKAYEKVLDLMPGASAVMYNKAILYMRQGQGTKAIDSLRLALERKDDLKKTAAKDPELRALRDDPAYKEAFKELVR